MSKVFKSDIIFAFHFVSLVCFLRLLFQIERYNNVNSFYLDRD